MPQPKPRPVKKQKPKVSFNHAMIYVRDVARAQHFYQDLLGLKTIDVMQRSNATALALDAGKTLLFDRDRLIAAADDAGIAIQAFAPGVPIAALARPAK